MLEYSIYNTNCSLKVVKVLFLYFISQFKIFNFAIDDLKQPREEIVGVLEGSYAHDLLTTWPLNYGLILVKLVASN